MSRRGIRWRTRQEWWCSSRNKVKLTENKLKLMDCKDYLDLSILCFIWRSGVTSALQLKRTVYMFLFSSMWFDDPVTESWITVDTILRVPESISLELPCLHIQIPLIGYVALGSYNALPLWLLQVGVTVRVCWMQLLQLMLPLNAVATEYPQCTRTSTPNLQ